MTLKFNILTELKDGPWGGGNQFLKLLKKEAKNRNKYSDIENADIILFNGHHDLYKALDVKEKYPEKIFIHRIDGPMDYRGKKGKKLDKKIFFLNDLIADGTIFQSYWSCGENIKSFMIENFAIIHNAPDPDIFYKKKNTSKLLDGKIKLVAVSWSTNPLKGFDIYQLLDEKLDFNRYEMSFVGNSNVNFCNIKTYPAMNSGDLADFLRTQDVFVFASKREACSNSLLEAIHCGLPCLVRDCSSNREIMKSNGLAFNSENIFEKLDKLTLDLTSSNSDGEVTRIDEICDQYLNFFSKIKQNYQAKKINNKIIYKFRIKFGLV